MKINELFNELNEDLYIVEFVKKDGDKYKVYSHKTGKIIGKKEGYENKEEAVKALLGMKTHGGFYNKTKYKQEKMIKNYITKHKV